jgi:hypothetical protein
MVKRAQGLALVQGYVIGFVAFDLILGIIIARMMDVAFVVYVTRVHPHNETTDPTGLGIPADVIADLECLSHGMSPGSALVRRSGQPRNFLQVRASEWPGTQRNTSTWRHSIRLHAACGARQLCPIKAKLVASPPDNPGIETLP